MAEGYPHPNIFCERHMETINCKVENCHYITSLCLNFLNNPAHYKEKTSQAVAISDFFANFSCDLSVFALDNYLHEVVTPGVPKFANEQERQNFWRCICTNKIIAIKQYLTNNEEYKSDPKFLDDLYMFTMRSNAEMRKVLDIPQPS